MIEEIFRIISDGKTRSVAEIAEETGFNYEDVAAITSYLKEKKILPSEPDINTNCNCKIKCNSIIKAQCKKINNKSY